MNTQRLYASTGLIRGLFVILFLLFTGNAPAQENISQEIQKGKILYEKGNYSQSEAVFQSVIERCERLQSTERSEYAAALHGLANVYHKKAYNEQADSLFSKACRLQKTLDETGLEYAILLTDHARHRTDISKFDSVENQLDTALKIIEEKEGKQSLEYAKTLSVWGIFDLLAKNNAETAIARLKQSETICREVAGDQCTVYADILLSTGHCYVMTKNLAEAERCYRQAKEIFQKELGINHLDYTATQFSLALVYSYQSRFQEAIDLILPVLPLIESSIGKENAHYIAAMSNLGGIYMLLNRHKEAEACLLATLESSEKKFSKTHHYYFNALNSLALLYSKQGLYEKAERLSIESLQLRKTLYGEQHLSVVLALNNLASLYADMRIEENAEKRLKEALQIAESAGFQRTADYAALLGNLASMYARRHDGKKALELYEQAEKILVENQMESHPTFLNIISNKLQYQANDTILSDAAVEKLFMKNLQQNNLRFGEYSFQSLLTTAKMGDFYYSRAKYEQAEDCYSQFIAHALTTNSSYPERMYFMGHTQKQLGKHEKSYDSFLKSFSQMKDNIRQNFAFLSEKERNIQWKRTAYFLNGFRQFSLNEWKRGNDSIAGFAYNNELLSKNMLLSTTQNINEAVLNSNDRELTAEWKKLSDLKNRLIKQETAPSISAEAKETLSIQAQEMEKQLLRKLQPYQELQDLFAWTWKDVQKQLHENEIAIEFSVVYPSKPDSDTTYCALLVHSGCNYPQMIELCKESELQAAIHQSPYDGQSIYPLIWKPLEKQMENISEIFIAPSGLLHGVSFAGMKTGNEYLGDRYILHQLLSTKDIATVKNKNANDALVRHIALFGGADYGLPPEEMNSMNFTRGQGFAYLPGSKKEVQDIAGQLAQKNWLVSLFVDRDATETRFKSFSSGQSPEVLHVSTHGFYFPPVSPASEPFFRQEFGDNRFRLSDNPLMRSGLLFTGANQVWNGKQLSNPDADDGILTAYEVSNLNLSNTELIVLSACETGLGDIISSEGIYGLQRAFRLAGVNTLLVSLWKVPDRETLQLMTAFYNGWQQENSISQAFSKAQRKLRKMYPGEPEKWAGFVLIEK